MPFLKISDWAVALPTDDQLWPLPEQPGCACVTGYARHFCVVVQHVSPLPALVLH
jgi:hypothetical protein